LSHGSSFWLSTIRWLQDEKSAALTDWTEIRYFASETHCRSIPVAVVYCKTPPISFTFLFSPSFSDLFKVGFCTDLFHTDISSWLIPLVSCPNGNLLAFCLIDVHQRLCAPALQELFCSLAKQSMRYTLGVWIFQLWCVNYQSLAIATAQRLSRIWVCFVLSPSRDWSGAGCITPNPECYIYAISHLDQIYVICSLRKKK
jgi:hypothetical protein